MRLLGCDSALQPAERAQKLDRSRAARIDGGDLPRKENLGAAKIRKLEVRRKYADDGNRPAVEIQGASNRIRISAETTHPESMPDQSHSRSAGKLVLGYEIAAGQHTH